MKLNTLLIALALTSGVFALTVDDVVPPQSEVSPVDSSLDETFLEVQSLLSQKGDDACQKLADDGIKEAKGEASTLEKSLDNEISALTNPCASKGDTAIKAAALAVKDSNAVLVKAKAALNKAKKTPVEFGTVSFKSIPEDTEHGPSFTDQMKEAFFAAKKLVDKAAGDRVAAKAIFKAAEKQLIASNDEKPDLVNTCMCDARRTAESNYAKRTKEFKESSTPGWTKANLMLCSLKKNSKTCTTVPKLPVVKDNSDGINCVPSQAQALTTDDCGGFRILNKCSNGKLALELMKSTTWDKSQTYYCPPGWSWASTNEFFSNIVSCPDEYAYYGLCGHNKYAKSVTYPGDRYKFRFSDSAANNRYQHAGSFIKSDFAGISSSTTDFAGIACIKN